jgi:signal transduction histidine kinase
LARSDAGAAEPQWSVVALDEVVLAETRSLRARDRVVVDVSGVSGAQVRGDAGHLRRAVRNLLENAERHAAGTVTVRLQEDGDDAELRVGDDGPGVPPELAERIFERFTRLDAARDRDHGGSGLGLAITRDIVVAHGGTIAVAPDPTPGATFVVRLPVASPGEA